jgi:uncharacterized protein (DUF433 family)
VKPLPLLTLALALALGVAFAAPAAAQTSLSVTVTTSDPKTMAGLLIGGIMASFFSAQNAEAAPAPAPAAPQTAVIIRTAPKPRDPWVDLPVWYVASYADVPVERIIELRRAGRRWVEIVERYRLPAEFRGRTILIEEKPSGRVKVKRGRPVFVVYSDEEFERFLFVRFLEEYYAVPRATVVLWLDRGLSLHDLFLSVNLATRVGVRPEVIIQYHLSGEPWERIARRYRLEVRDLGRPVIIEQKRHRARVRFER